MIKVYDQVPAVYYKESRDFQVLGRAFDIVLNYLKTNIDTIYHNPLDRCSDKKLLDLLSLTLGFEAKHNYNLAQLTSVCSSLAEIIKWKGSKKSIELTVNCIQNAQGINNLPEIQVKDNLIKIFLSTYISDTALLNDMLDYIIPAGMSVQIINSINLNPSQDLTTTVINSGTSSFNKSISSQGTSATEDYEAVNYIPKLEDTNTDFGKAGNISNITVTRIDD